MKKATTKMNRIINIPRLLLVLLTIVIGAASAWAQNTITKSTWDGTVPSTAIVSAAECNKIGITGSGTETDPYVISTAGQFAYFASKMNDDAAWWELKANIELDLDGKNHEWTYGKNNWTFKGHFDGNGSTISNMKIETNVTGRSWGLFPNLQGSSATNHAEIKNLNIKNFTITTPTSGSYAAANIGLLVGKANGNTDIENITVTGGTIAVDVETTGYHNVAGLVGQLAGAENYIKNCTVSNASITSGTAKKKDYYVGGLVGSVATYPVVTITGNTVSNLTVTLDGNTSGSNVIGGLIGKTLGLNSTIATGYPMGKRSVIQHNTVESPAITMNGSVDVKTLELGGMIGWIGSHTNVFNNKVTSPTISLTNNINAESYVGGAIGYQDAYTYVDGMTVSNGSITGPSEDKNIKNNITFFVGGYVGYMVSSGTTKFQANKFKNIAVTGMDINLGHYVPAAQIQNHKFSVGGIAGAINAPNMTADYSWNGMPENLIFKGGKIYAPWASTSPIVGNFNAAAAAHQNMTLDVVTTVDAIEKAKANTWYYYDYKLGLSDDFLKSASVIAENAAPTHLKFRKNYSKATETIDSIQYLAIDNSTLTRSNRYQDSERDLKTVLWWTQQASMDNSKGIVAAATCFTANEQPIYPQSGATAAVAGNLADYPYYMYFFQGVGNAKYASNTDAANIVKGIEANLTNNVMPAVAMTGENILNVIVTNDGEKRRGFDERTLSVAVMKGTTDITSKYRYQWYLNGKADGTGTTKSLTPHWKDGQGVTVNVLDSLGNFVATASYGFAPGVLHTKNSIEEPTDPEAKKEEIRSNIGGRGTSANPYIIDCESALRQLSYLSTAHTSTYWETLGKPAAPYPTNQPQGHYNHAYYELSADIDLKNNEFTPISHVGYGSDSSFGTYNTNWIFQGVFDGKGHAIKNFKVTWGVSQYVGYNSNMYYGLFGCVGNATAARKWGDAANGNTVIKNLVIDGATLTHNTSETSFYYDQSISTNANNCFVGVLAGIVSSNTTIQNIEIRNSKITDEGSQDYSLAAKGLYVGGAIGSVQAGFSAIANVPANTTTQHIAAQVNITLTHPTIVKETDATQTASLNVGGILGRFVATGATKAQVDPVVPAYTIYSGTINAPKAWISPVVASMRYSAQQGFNFNNHSKHWEGNNLTAATQITITNALYYDFYIGGEKITDTYPSNTCGLGSRTMTAHADGTDAAGTYAAQKYQGVNYGAQYLDAVGAPLAYLNENAFEDIHWVWQGGFVHMTTDSYVEATISRVDNVLTAGLVGAAPVSYKWKASFDGETWIEIPSAVESVYEAYPSLKLKYIVAYVNDGKKDYRTYAEKVEPNPDLINPTITEDGNTYSFNLNSTAPEGQMVTNYEWYETKDTPFSPAVVNTDLTLSDAQMEAHNGIAWCKVVVTELGVVMYEDLLIAGATVIYVNGYGYKGDDAGVGNDNNDGLTPQTPVLTIDKANSLLKKNGTWDDNIIVVMGVLDNDYKFQSNGSNAATLTGKWNGVDYHGVIKLDQINPSEGEHNLNPISATTKGSNCYVLGDTKFENLIFYGNKSGNCFIELHGNDAIFGKGLVMQNFRDLSNTHGNMGNAETIPEFTVLLMATNLSEERIQQYTKRIHDRGKPQTVTFQSGHYGRLMGGRFTQNFFANPDNSAHSILASAEYPIWAEVNVEIDPDNEPTDKQGKTYTRDVNAIIAGLTDGTMYGDYTINFYGGNVAYIVGANQGNPVNNGDLYYTPLHGKNGKWGQWPNASYFGRTVINIDQKEGVKGITVGNLYAGGLGRMVQNGSSSATVDMYVYGRTEVNVKKGTVSGSVYGGGVGGVLGVNPWDAHVPYATTAADALNNAIINKVQYGDTRYGSWSSMTTESPMAKVTLHNLKESGDGYETVELDLSTTTTNVNIIGGTVNGNVYGGGYGFVQDMPEDATMQGVGSVFGISNISVTGGAVFGNIYGGSQGHTEYYLKTNRYGQKIDHIAEMNGTANLKITGNEDVWPTIGGDIYGGGKGIQSEGNEEYLRIATAGNAELDAEDPDKYTTDVNIYIDLPESHPFEGNIYGGGEMGAVDGKTNVVIKSGYFDGNVYGGGQGEEGHTNKAKVTGETNVEIGTKTVNVPITSDELDPDAEGVVTITGSVFGGGQKAIVAGNTRVKVGDQD